MRGSVYSVALGVVAGAVFLVTGGVSRGGERLGPEDLTAGWALTEDELDAERGGETPLPTPFEPSRVGGTVEGNVVYSATTGTNLVTEGAFSGAAGFTTVIQNSGNNVLIQDSTVINVIVR